MTDVSMSKILSLINRTICKSLQKKTTKLCQILSCQQTQPFVLNYEKNIPPMVTQISTFSLHEKKNVLWV